MAGAIRSELLKDAQVEAVFRAVGDCLADHFPREIEVGEELVAGGAGSHALSRLMLGPLGRSKPAPLRGCTMLEDVELALLPEDTAEDTADLPDGDVVLDALDEHRHQVGLRTGRVFEQ